MEEYVKHINKDNRVSWCGEPGHGFEFRFADLDHAALNGLNDGRLVACKKCTDAAIKALQNGQE